MDIKAIRNDLREIRYYYAKQKEVDGQIKLVENSITEKVERYNRAMKDAPIRLYDVYISLYIRNNSLVALAYDWDYSPEYIKQLNNQLCEYLQQALDKAS